MKAHIFNPQSMIKTLIITSVMMFISLFIAPKVAALGMTIWIINIGWIMHLLTKGRIKEMQKYHEKSIEEAKKIKGMQNMG